MSILKGKVVVKIDFIDKMLNYLIPYFVQQTIIVQCECFINTRISLNEDGSKCTIFLNPQTVFSVQKHIVKL